MATARQAAEASKAATVLDTFKDGVDLARQAETEYKASRFATAARQMPSAMTAGRSRQLWSGSV